ncbi:MAG: helix-turn-helix domain-containing protein [Sphingomonas sp.]
MESVSTDTLRRAGKAAAWNEIYSGLLAAADVIPGEDDFSAGLMLSHVGRVGIARLATGRCTIRRTAAHIDSESPRLYSFIIQANGRGSFVQGSNKAVLNPGDFTLCDHAAPHSRILDTGAEMLLVRVPAELIGEYLPCPELLCGRRLPAGEGLTPSAGVMVRSLWKRLELGFSSRYEDCVAHHLLELIATSYSMVFGTIMNGPTTSGARFLAVQRHVEDCLRDPHFKPSAIAAGVHMTPQEVRRLFAMRGESARGYILRRRLDEAARRLRDPKWRGHTIAEIAYCWGFHSSAQFARCFRDRFGLSPTEYREAGVN